MGNETPTPLNDWAKLIRKGVCRVTELGDAGLATVSRKVARGKLSMKALQEERIGADIRGCIKKQKARWQKQEAKHHDSFRIHTCA